MKDSKRLTIRINFASQQNNITENNVPNNDSSYQYHWGRIIGAFLIVVLIIASVISASRYYNGQGDVADKKVELPLVHTTVLKVTNTAQPAPLDNTEKPNTPLAVASSTLPDTTPVIASDLVPEEIIEQVTEQVPHQKVDEKKLSSTVKIESNKTKNDLLTTSPVEESTVTVQENTEVLLPITSNNENTIQALQPELAIETPSIEDSEQLPLFSQSETKLLSKNIERFIISPSIQRNEPVGTINDIIFDDNNLATIYAFSEVSGLENTTLYYVWSFDGKTVAKVKVDINAKRWRSYSSKFIQPNMHGEWKVELQNRKGDKLAINRFSY